MARLRRSVVVTVSLLLTTLTIGLLLQHNGHEYHVPLSWHELHSIFKPTSQEPPKPHPIYKPEPSWLPPPIKDPFQSLIDTGKTPPIPSYNTPEKDLWKKYGLDTAPPLFIGFTRTWPMVLQAVVSYITAGWPPELIYVVENTGVQQANTRGQLTLQNPFYLNHTTLKTLGVNVIQTPALLSFAQLQNFYLSLTYQHDWPYYFWSHMDVIALSHEQGLAGSPKAGEKGYKSLYHRVIEELGKTMKLEQEWQDSLSHGNSYSKQHKKDGDNHKDKDTDHKSDKRKQSEKEGKEHEGKWAARFFAYDHLTLMNPRAVEDVGGWDSLIPYYITDCDMYTRFAMKGWQIRDRDAGIVTDVATAFDDLRALYQVDGIEPTWKDPNPPPPKEEEEEIKEDKEKEKRSESGDNDEAKSPDDDDKFAKWRRLREEANNMFHYKHGNRGRNTWQLGQHGGQDEPFYYDAAGVAEAINILTEAGRQVYRHKWAKGDCDLIDGGGLQFGDMWKVQEKKERRRKRADPNGA